MFHALRARPAESLIETLVAITVLVIATTAALSLIRTSLTGSSVIGEKVVAINLALEGIEAVRNIRDTNYLRFASDAKNCWNKLGLEDVSNCSNGLGREIEDETTYYLERNFDPSGILFEWTLKKVIGNKIGELDLYESDIDISGDGDEETIELYAQSGGATGFSRAVDNPYVRTLFFEYLNDNTFNVTATVSWEMNGLNKSVSLTRTIANVY